LKINHNTLRNRFPDVIAPHKRRSPVDVNDPKWPGLIAPLAADPNWTTAAACAELGISFEPMRAICRLHRIAWVANKSKGRTGRPKGSKDKKQRTPNRPWSELYATTPGSA
jgi:hypothetical protein